jgi:DNA-binding transcriptional LysR family regulator
LFKTYVKVVENHNLSRTAEELNLSQPAVSKQIQALEEMYGVLLLERSGRKLKTTTAGEALYDCAREILRVLEKTDQIMEEISESRRGRLMLGASTIPGQYILPTYLKGFKDRFPNVNISMKVADTENIFNLVAERELDLGIIGGWIANRKVESFKWLEDELVVLVPAGHRLAGLAFMGFNDWVFNRCFFLIPSPSRTGTLPLESKRRSRFIHHSHPGCFLNAGISNYSLPYNDTGVGN